MDGKVVSHGTALSAITEVPMRERDSVCIGRPPAIKVEMGLYGQGGESRNSTRKGKGISGRSHTYLGSKVRALVQVACVMEYVGTR